MQVEGYPNMFMILGPHTARGNIPRNIEEVVEWQTGLIKHMRENGLTRAEPRPEAVGPWIDKVNEASANLLMTKIPSWQTGVNRNVEGRQVPRVLGYNGGAVRYRRMIEKQAAEGYPEFLFG